ncbi:hydroxypyruvate reductase-like [Pyrus x bretschneideri]|uniref:hydroxypyruvate reductase-like n=1 Tax=Pyrus x bretschneideri TaxID=225117 RepID=UPI00202F59EE|nr:hydroxypyruvate reductase-like [Pyrus x bretschneideri]
MRSSRLRVFAKAICDSARHRHPHCHHRILHPTHAHTLSVAEMHSLSKMEVENGEVKNKEKVSRLLFCGSHFPAAETYTREYLKDYPFIQVDDVPHKDVPGVIQNYNMCIVKLMKLDSDLLSRAEKMKLVLQYGVGLEGVDIDSATKFGIKVARIPSHVTGNAASCAEMAIYLMLGLLRKQNEMQISIKLRKVGDPVGETLLGKTIFILGYGNIGIELAKRLRPFGVKIIASKRSWATQSQDSCQSNVQNCSTENLVDEKCVHEDIHKFASIADIVVCCINLNSETVGIVNKSFISSMRKGALLVNIARGGLLDYEAVSYNLESGHLGGLGIDVAWTEPFDPDDPILKFNNVIITPHVAGVTEYSYRSMAKVVGDAAIQLHEGKPLTGIEFVN